MLVHVFHSGRPRSVELCELSRSKDLATVTPWLARAGQELVQASVEVWSQCHAPGARTTDV